MLDSHIKKLDRYKLWKNSLGPGPFAEKRQGGPRAGRDQKPGAQEDVKGEEKTGDGGNYTRGGGKGHRLGELGGSTG